MVSHRLAVTFVFHFVPRSFSHEPSGSVRVQRTTNGLPFRIVLYAPDKPPAKAAARAAFDRIQQLNAILSDYEDDSELSRLSRTAGSGQAVRVSDDLWFVLKRAQNWRSGPMARST